MSTDYTAIIKKKLKQRKITLSELAEKLNTSQSALTQSLGENSNPSLKRLVSIADALGISLLELLADGHCSSHGITCPHCGKEIKVKSEISVVAD